MKKLLRLLSALCLFLIVANTSYAQIRVISGNVKDSRTSQGMVGVSVQVKGTNVGTYTDQDGNYSLALPSNATTLEFKFLGSKTIDVPIGTSNTVDATLEPDVLGLSEVVVTALGISEEKKSLGYSTQTVTSDQLNQSGTGNALEELSGKVAGFTVFQTAGDPGAGVSMQLRGETSLTGNNQPLMVVDGIPIDNSVNDYDPINSGFQGSSSGSGIVGSGTGDALSGAAPNNRGIDIDPNDIASVTVLKGPAATALYGIKAANGALIITTKRGTGGKKGPTIEFNTAESFSQVNQLPQLQMQYAAGTSIDPTTGLAIAPVWVGADGKLGNGSAGGNVKGQQKFNWGPPIDSLSWTGTPFTSASGGVYDSHGRIVFNGDPLAKTPVTPYNNEDEFFQTGWTEDNNIALSGGNDKAGYRFSLGNVNTTGVIPLSKYNKTNFSLNGQANLSSKFSTSGGLNYVTSASDMSQTGSNVSSVMLGLLRTPNTFDNANGITSNPAGNPEAYIFPDSTQRDFRGGPGYDNPFWTVNRNPFHQDLNRVYGYGQADYKPLTWMTITYRLGGDMYTQQTKQDYDILSNAFFGSGGIFIADYFNKQINSDFIVNMQHQFSKNLSGSLILGQNYFSQTSNLRFQEGEGLVIPDFFDLSNATVYISEEGETEIRRMAWYGDAQLNYKSMLFLTVTGRDETSSTLPADNDVFFYPSVDLGWVFTETFGLSSNSIFPYGKLRLSYANVGNDAPPHSLTTPFGSPFINNGFTTSGGISFPFDGLAGYSISSPINTIGNPTLKPENTGSFEAGVDLAFLKNRISLNFTYYNEKTTNEIFTVPISYTTGWSAAELNAGQLTNTGEEVTLNVTPIKQKNNGFRWDLTFNWAHNSNMVNSLYPGVNQLLLSGFTNGGVYAVAGQPYGVIYGSVYQRSDPSNMNSPLLIDDRQTIGGQPNPGYGMPMEANTTAPIGNIQPDWTGSVISTFSFKGISLGFQIDVRQGGSIWNGTQGAIDYFGTGIKTANRGQTTVFSGVLGHLDDNGNVVHGASDASGAGGTNNITATYNQYYWQNIGSSFIGPTEPDVESASSTRFRSISLSYALPSSIVQKMHLYGLSITVFANNPILWTKYTGVDPETSLTGPANGLGLDYFNNPDTRSYGIRLNVTL